MTIKFKLMVFQSNQIDDFRRFPSLSIWQFAHYKELKSNITSASTAYECTFYANPNLYWPQQLHVRPLSFLYANLSQNESCCLVEQTSSMLWPGLFDLSLSLSSHQIASSNEPFPLVFVAPVRYKKNINTSATTEKIHSSSYMTSEKC